MANPIKYTSRTYRSILTDINSDADLADKPEWWKRLWAGVGDTLSVWLNAQANNMYLETAFTREAVTELCRLIDYELSPRLTSSGEVLFHLSNSATFPVAVAQEDLRATTPGSISESAKRFEARVGASLSLTSETFTADAGTDVLTVARDYTTGEKVSASSTGTLPAPLSASGEYYAIRVSATEIKLASSPANAYAGTALDITSAGSGTHTLTLRSLSATLYQQRSVDQYEAGETDGISEWQEVRLRDLHVLEGTEQVVINSVTWTRVDTFVDSGPADTHYRLIYNTDGGSFLRFGNGTYGAVPGDFRVLVSYAVGGGLDSNVASANRITVYAGSDPDVVGVSNPAAMTGGADAESLDSARRLAPILLKARNRFVSVGDGEALAQEFTGASISRVNPNAFGVLSAQVLVVAPGGGNLSAGAKADLQSYLVDRTLMASMDIRVEDVTFVTSNVVADVSMGGGSSFAAAEPYIELAIKMALDETGQEIVDTFETSGIETAVELINTIFSASFGAGDYGQITTLIENLDPVDFGEDVYASSVEGFVDAFVSGVSHISISSPAFPVAVGTDEISSAGTVSLTEV